MTKTPSLLNPTTGSNVDARFRAFCTEYMAQFGWVGYPDRGVSDVRLVDVPYGLVITSAEWQYTILLSGRQDGKVATMVVLTQVDDTNTILCNELVRTRSEDGSEWCRRVEEVIEGYIMENWCVSRKPFVFEG